MNFIDCFDCFDFYYNSILYQDIYPISMIQFYLLVYNRHCFLCLD